MRSLRRYASRFTPARRIESRIVWIFSSPRSGSTWLASILAEHPSISAINEPRIGYYLSPFLGDLPGFDPRALDSDNFTIRLDGSRHEFFSPRYEQVWQPHLARMICRRFQAQAAREGGGRPLLVVKEPSGSQSADLLMRTLPRSRLLFLIRDGRDVVDSELAANAPGAWVTRVIPGAVGVSESERVPFAIQSAARWLWRTEVTERAYGNHDGPKLRVRYEDLLADPGRFRGIFDWLGLAVADHEFEAMIEAHSFERSPSGAGDFHRSARAGGWRDGLSREELDAVESVIGAKLRDLGYGIA